MKLLEKFTPIVAGVVGIWTYWKIYSVNLALTVNTYTLMIHPPEDLSDTPTHCDKVLLVSGAPSEGYSEALGACFRGFTPSSVEGIQIILGVIAFLSLGILYYKLNKEVSYALMVIWLLFSTLLTTTMVWTLLR